MVAVEVDFNDSHYYATRSVLLSDGKIGVTVAFTCDTQTQLWEHVRAIAKDPSVKFAFTPTVDLQCPPYLQARRVIVGYAEILKWTPAVQGLIREKQIVHTGEMALAEHVVRAVSVRTQGSIAVQLTAFTRTYRAVQDNDLFNCHCCRQSSLTWEATACRSCQLRYARSCVSSLSSEKTLTRDSTQISRKYGTIELWLSSRAK